MQVQNAQASPSATPVHSDHVTNQCKIHYLTSESNEFEFFMKPTPKRHMIVLETVALLSLLDKELVSSRARWAAPPDTPRFLHSC